MELGNASFMPLNPNKNIPPHYHSPPVKAGRNPSKKKAKKIDPPLIETIQVGETEYKVSELLFDTKEEARGFYYLYGQSLGFEIRTKYQQKKNTENKDHEVLAVDGTPQCYYLDYCCTWEGYRPKSENNPQNSGKLDFTKRKRQRPEERNGCPARIRLKWDAVIKKFYVTFWEVRHTQHDFINDDSKHLQRSRRKVDPLSSNLAKVHKYAGVTNRSSFDIMAQIAGGTKYVGFTEKDLKNHQRPKRIDPLTPEEYSMMQKHFRERARSDKNFFYEMQEDEDGYILSVFWADGRQRAEFSVFGDSISFDTTYRTNREHKPLGAFAGYNHHRQLVVFGAALLYDETTETFEWLFSTFKKCMSDKKPTSIFTDSAAAIAAGCRSQFPLPETFHGLCTFHIINNAAANLGTLFTKEFVAELQYLMFSVDNVKEFEDLWKLMIENCFPGKGPEGHSWMTYIYEKRQQWSRAWLKKHFTCGMRSSQLSETFNSNLRDYMTPDMTLQEFFTQFIRLVENKREEELKKDFKMRTTVPINRFSESLLTKQLALVYTPKVFKKWLEEYAPTLSYSMRKCGESETGLKFKVFKAEIDGTTTDERVVTISSDGKTMTCTCCMFEMEGLLCRHLSRVRELLGHRDNSFLLTIPDELILKRYRRTAKEGLEMGEVVLTVAQEDLSKFHEMTAVMAEVRTKANGDSEMIETVIRRLTELAAELSKMKPTPQGPAPTPTDKILKNKKVTFKPRKRPISARERHLHSLRKNKKEALVNYRKRCASIQES